MYGGKEIWKYICAWFINVLYHVIIFISYFSIFFSLNEKSHWLDLDGIFYFIFSKFYTSCTNLSCKMASYCSVLKYDRDIIVNYDCMGTLSGTFYLRSKSEKVVLIIQAYNNAIIEILGCAETMEKC